MVIWIFVQYLICDNMRFSILLPCLLAIAGPVLAQQGNLNITNPGTAAYESAVVEIPWSTVAKAYPQVDTAQLRVVRADNGQEVAYQLEKKGGSAVQNLLVQVTVAPKGSVGLVLSKGKPTPVKPMTYGRYVPERYDDFAWENDRVAFRIYGKALNGRSDNAYGSDIWAKRTPELIINKWYKQNDYHKDNGDGLDYYKVGLTLGAGDVGVFLNDSIQYIHNYTTWEVLDNGPLRTTFRVKYDPYTFKGVTVTQTKTISLDAGAQLSKIRVDVTHTAPGQLPMVAGIVLRPEESPLLLDDKNGVLGYWEPKHGPDGTIGVGCVFPGKSAGMMRKYGHGLARLAVKSGDGITYYSGGAWDKAGLITSSDAWFAYLQAHANRLRQPLVVTTSAPRKAGR
ncbi:DUF4861 family protein [Rudanella lutea]|uniref:DUF4861 family protein n=1 Tax=Rudanella lutea TaxID=451374 RepID=UPI00037A56AA|nr:DUF4861 family protein [Rudanella lutea]